MQNLQEYLQVFKNIVEKEIINEISQKAFTMQVKGNVLDKLDSNFAANLDANTDSIESIVKETEGVFADLENQSMDFIIKRFKDISRGLCLKAINQVYSDNNIKKITLNQLDNILTTLINKYSQIKSSGKEGQTLSIPNAGLEIKNLIQNEILQKNNISNRPTKEQEGIFKDSKKFSDEFLKTLEGQEIFKELEQLYKKLPNDENFKEACKKLSFMVTLHIRLNQVYINGKYDGYLEDILKPNDKILLTAQKLSTDQYANVIKDYEKYIKKQNPKILSKIKPTNLIEFKPKTIENEKSGAKAVKALQYTLPAFKSKIGEKVCSGAGACAAYCYAAAGTYQYPLGTFKSEFSLMFSLSNEFVPVMRAHLLNLIKSMKNKYFIMFRIHDSGDFYSANYLKKWIKIAKIFPNIYFYGYTKQVDLLPKILPPNFKFTQSFGGRNDVFLSKLLKIKSNPKFNKIEDLTEKERKAIIRYLNINTNPEEKITEQDWDEENFKRILNNLNISQVFTSKEEFEKYKQNFPNLKWELVTDDDIPAVNLNVNAIALIVHGTNSGKLKEKKIQIYNPTKKDKLK
jgi:hypothetical protein